MLSQDLPRLLKPISILLGSTSHYLVQVCHLHCHKLLVSRPSNQKCSVPVMVARRRLRRPARRSAHLSSHRARVSLAEAAGVERVTPKVDREVEHMRDQLEREDGQEDRDQIVEAGDDEETEHETDTVQIGEKVAGD